MHGQKMPLLLRNVILCMLSYISSVFYFWSIYVLYIYDINFEIIESVHFLLFNSMHGLRFLCFFDQPVKIFVFTINILTGQSISMHQHCFSYKSFYVGYNCLEKLFMVFCQEFKRNLIIKKKYCIFGYIQTRQCSQQSSY